MTTIEDLVGMSESLKPTLDPGIYVEPRDRSTANEEARQATWVALMRKTARACMVVAVPNGARRTRWEANKAKREGLLAGFPDTITYWSDGGALIEWKDAAGKPSDAQIETLNWLHARGQSVAICRSPEGAMAWLRSIGAPVPALNK